MGSEVSLSHAEFELLNHFHDGVSVQDACDRLKSITGIMPRRATMYGLFTSLRDKGLIVEAGSERVGSGRPKRLFTTTMLGLAAIQLYRDIMTWQEAHRSTRIDTGFEPEVRVTRL